MTKSLKELEEEFRRIKLNFDLTNKLTKLTKYFRYSNMYSGEGIKMIAIRVDLVIILKKLKRYYGYLDVCNAELLETYDFDKNSDSRNEDIFSLDEIIDFIEDNSDDFIEALIDALIKEQNHLQRVQTEIEKEIEKETQHNNKDSSLRLKRIKKILNVLK